MNEQENDEMTLPDRYKIKSIIGIDPGANGSISIYDVDTNTLVSHKMPETPKDVYDLLKTVQPWNSICYLEKVHGRPGGGSSGMFNYGKGYGYLEMALLVCQISTVTIMPQKWMKELGVGTRGDMNPTDWKNKLKAKAQQLYPQNKLTLATCDAALIVTYGIRQLNN